MEICLGYQLHIYAQEIYNPPEFVVIISYKCSGTNLFRFTTSKN